MNSSAYFLLSFAGPILAGGLMASVVWDVSDWLRENVMNPLPVILVAFIFSWFVARKLIHHFVAVRCPNCKKKAAYEMENIACRFRCTVCTKEF